MFTNRHQVSTLSDIAVFVTVVQAGSFTAAAERLEMSKSVVSKYVSRLEDRLAARLLVRTTRRLKLTEAGATLFEQSRHGLDVLVHAEESVSALQREPRGALRINCPMSFGVLHIAPAISDFMARYPDVSVDLTFDDRKVDMIDGGYDVSVRIASQLDPSLVARRIGPCRHVVVASPAYLERNGEPLHPNDLARHNVITYQYHQLPWEWEFRTGNSAPVTVSVTGSLQMNNSLAIREAVLAGVGISRMPTFVAGRDAASGALRVLLAEFGSPELSIYVVLAQRRHMASKVRVFIDFLAERFSGTPYWDESAV